jgi:uncharacterized protein YndB with AHSA1/START domain
MRKKGGSITERDSRTMQPAEQVLSITRIFDAPPSFVFKFWTQSEHMAEWSCPKDFMTTFCEGDIHPGGAWRMCMRSPEGKDYCIRGIYQEIAEPERIIFTHAWENPEGKPGHETLVTVSFSKYGEKTGEQTKLTFHQGVFESVAERNSHEEGWNECFDKLADCLKALKY